MDANGGEVALKVHEKDGMVRLSIEKVYEIALGMLCAAAVANPDCVATRIREEDDTDRLEAGDVYARHAEVFGVNQEELDALRARLVKMLGEAGLAKAEANPVGLEMLTQLEVAMRLTDDLDAHIRRLDRERDMHLASWAHSAGRLLEAFGCSDEEECTPSSGACATVWCLYLDDERDPKTPKPWVVVRTVDELKVEVERRGFPLVVSLDHDLGEGEPTGMDAMHYLVDLGRTLGIDPHTLEWNVHSANVAGAANMRGLLESWRKWWRMEHPEGT
jgi:hypothetical protein